MTTPALKPCPILDNGNIRPGGYHNGLCNTCPNRAPDPDIVELRELLKWTVGYLEGNPPADVSGSYRSMREEIITQAKAALQKASER